MVADDGVIWSNIMSKMLNILCSDQTCCGLGTNDVRCSKLSGLPKWVLLHSGHENCVIAQNFAILGQQN